MPTMFEIYDRHAAEYAELVDAEDHEGNLARCLLGLTDWHGKRVIEAGVGTGRVTQIYADAAGSVVCFDRSRHMMEFAARRLASYRHKLQFDVGDNLAMPQVWPKCDIFIEGWSWGHSIAEPSRPVESTAELLLDGVERNLRTGGMTVLIETMGSNARRPAAPQPRLGRFYELLVTRYGFKQEIVRTDYRFPSAEEAIRIMGFFFGEAMAGALAETRPTIVPEWTGVWWTGR